MMVTTLCFVFFFRSCLSIISCLFAPLAQWQSTSLVNWRSRVQFSEGADVISIKYLSCTCKYLILLFSTIPIRLQIFFVVLYNIQPNLLQYMAGRPHKIRSIKSYINNIDAHTFAGPMKSGTSPSVGVTHYYWHTYATQCNQNPNQVKKSYNNMVFSTWLCQCWL